MQLTKAFLLLICVSLLSFTTVSNTPAGWRMLGDKKVGFGVDHDVIHFSNWGDDVRQLKLKVTDGPLRLYNLKIHFDNGGVQNVELRNRFNQGSESRVIDLDGGLRHLSKIEFWYETRGFLRGKSRVEVWGRE